MAASNSRGHGPLPQMAVARMAASNNPSLEERGIRPTKPLAVKQPAAGAHADN
jgi:hypothetical protein